MVDICRKHGISPATFDQWRSKLGALKVSEARQLWTLEAESTRPKKRLAEVVLDNAMLKDIASKSGDTRSAEGCYSGNLRGARDQQAEGVHDPWGEPEGGPPSAAQTRGGGAAGAAA